MGKDLSILKVELRELTIDDWELTMAWRSNPSTYGGAYTQRRALTWDEHYRWMITRGRWWKFFIILFNNRKVGVFNYGQLDNWNPEFNCYLGEYEQWKSGVADEAIKLGLNWLKERGYCKTHTTIPDINNTFVEVIKRLGFRCVGEARKGESLYEIKLSEIDGSTEYASGRKPL